MSESAPYISIVVPVLNEETNLKTLYSRLVIAMEAYGRTFEIVVVDDGSTDGSYKILQELHAQDPRLRIVRLARNFGQTPALYAGFAHVKGEVAVTIDADLQNPPEEIPKVIEKLGEGYDAVQGWRENRQDSLFRRTASKMLNRFISWLMKTQIRDLGCGLKAFTRETVDRLCQFTHNARYLPAEVVWLGLRLGEVKVEHQARESGGSKYGIMDLLRLNFNIVSSLSAAPIKIIGMMGLLLSVVGFGMGARIFYMRLMYGNYDKLASVTAIFFVLAGIQLIATGLMCEYIGRIYLDVQRRPFYVVRNVLE